MKLRNNERETLWRESSDKQLSSGETMNSKNRVLERKTTQRGGAAEVDGGVSGD
jgi:hypothetical protein